MDTVTDTGAVPVVPVGDTLRKLPQDGSAGETLPREELWLTQTPQGYRLDVLLPALSAAPDVTDEASALEIAGHQVAAVPGDRMNVKLTTPEDMEILERFAAGDRPPGTTRIGHGLDFHPFRDDRPLIIAGCRLSEEGGLLGRGVRHGSG